MFDVVGVSKNSSVEGDIDSNLLVEYVTAIEGKRIPIVGLQFHPEYVMYENLNSDKSAKSAKIAS